MDGMIILEWILKEIRCGLDSPNSGQGGVVACSERDTQSERNSGTNF
jgi:hypothetical protein